MTDNTGNTPVATQLEDRIEFVTEGIVSKELVDGDFGEVGLYCMSAGKVMSEHTSSRNAVVHYIKGKGRIKLGERWYAAVPGAWFFMPANLPHALEAEEDTVFLLTLFGS